MKKLIFIIIFFASYSLTSYADTTHFIDFTKVLNSSKAGSAAQLKSLENFFSNQSNSKIILSLAKCLKIEKSKIINKNGKFSGKTIMFTGGFKKISRSEAKSLVEENGGKILGSLSKKLNILVVGNNKPTKSKIEKSKELGVDIIYEDDWYKFLNI